MKAARSLLSALALFSASLICGCQTSGSSNGNTSNDDLASMFTYIEKPEAASGSSSDITIDASKQLAPIDYNSRITINPDKTKIKNLVSKSGTQIKAPPPDALDRLNHIPDVINQAKTYLADVELASAAVAAEAAQPGRVPGTALSAETSALVQKRAKEGLALLGFVETVARSRVKLEHPDYTEPQIKVAVSAIRSPLIFDDTGKKRVAFNLNAFGAFLQTEATWLAALTKADRDQIVASAKLLRIRAQLVSLGKQAIPIHIDNYDNLTDANPTKEARLAFTMDDATKQRTDQELKTTGDVATIVNQAKDPNSDLSKTLKQLGSAKTLETFLDDLRTHLKSAAAPFTDTNAFTAVKTIIHDAAAATQDPGQRADLTALEDSLAKKLGGPTGSIATLQNTLSQLDDLKKQAADPTKLPDIIQKSTAAIGTIPDTVNEIKADIPRIDTLLKVVPAVLQAKAAQTRQIFADQVMKDLTAISTATLSDYPDLTQTITSFLSGVTGDPNAFAGDSTPSSYKTLPLDELVQGTIHLNETAAREGDQLDVKFEVFSNDPQTPKTVPDLQDRKDFKVDKFGLINTWTTSLAFARQTSGATSNSFVAAPSLAWTLHYRPRISADTDFTAKTWSFIDPGAGMNVEGLNFNNTNGTGVQVGVGGHISVLHDLLQIGGGYNLSVTHDRAYIYVGIGVFQTLQQAAALLHTAGR